MNQAVEKSWFDAVVVRFERPLLAYAYRMSGKDWQAAQDAVQETFLRLHRADQQTIEHRLAPWLFTVCRSRVIDHRRLQPITTVAWTVDALIDRHADVSETVSQAEQRQQLESCLGQLSPRQQEVIRLKLSGDLSYREIAEVTGMTVSNVGFHLHQAIARLRQLIASVS